MNKDDKSVPPAEGWSVDTALQHVLSLMGANDHRYEQRFLDQQHAVSNALTAAEAAVRKAETAAEKRFDSVNEFRNTLGDQQRTLMPRAEAEEKFRSLEKQLDTVTATLSALVSERRGIAGGWGAAVVAAGFVLTIVTLIAIAAKVYAAP